MTHRSWEQCTGSDSLQLSHHYWSLLLLTGDLDTASAILYPLIAADHDRELHQTAGDLHASVEAVDIL